jgi:precorrin-2 dehydrogenase/sirohydrochlorin ferrochelatase
MKYYPIFLRVAQRPCLVVGGGKIGQQKVESLMDAGAAVTLISPEVTPQLAAWAAARRLTHHQRRYITGDLRGFLLAYAATGNDAVDRAMAREASEAGVLLNVVDRRADCDFLAPATMQRGDLIIAASTSGSSPALAKRIRRDLEARYGSEYALALQVLGRLRERLRQARRSPAERKRIFTALAESALLDYLRSGNREAVDRLLARTVGDGVSMAGLGLEWSGQ